MAGISWPNYRAILLSSMRSISTDSVLFPLCDHSLYKVKWSYNDHLFCHLCCKTEFKQGNGCLKSDVYNQERVIMAHIMYTYLNGAVPVVCCPWFYKKKMEGNDTLIWWIVKKSSIMNWNMASIAIPLCLLFPCS